MLPSSVGFPLMAFARTPSRSRIVWHGFSEAATTEGVSRTCGVSISVRGSLLVFHRAKSAHGSVLFRHHRDDAVGPSPDAGRPATAVPRALHDPRRMQDHHHRPWRGSIILQQCLRLRHPNVPLVAHDVHNHRRSAAAPHAHHGVLPEQNPGVRVAKRRQVLNDVWMFDFSGSLDRIRWEQVTISERKRPSPRG